MFHDSSDLRANSTRSESVLDPKFFYELDKKQVTLRVEPFWVSNGSNRTSQLVTRTSLTIMAIFSKIGYLMNVCYVL